MNNYLITGLNTDQAIESLSSVMTDEQRKQFELALYKKYLKVSRKALRDEIEGMNPKELLKLLFQDNDECDVYISCLV